MERLWSLAARTVTEPTAQTEADLTALARARIGPANAREGGIRVEVRDVGGD